MKKAVCVYITGKVQNVGFRFATQKKAKELGVSGFVKNMSDGSVYVEAEAPEEILEKFIFWCRVGPDWARVSEVVVSKRACSEYVGFVIR